VSKPALAISPSALPPASTATAGATGSIAKHAIATSARPPSTTAAATLTTSTGGRGASTATTVTTATKPTAPSPDVGATYRPKVPATATAAANRPSVPSANTNRRTGTAAVASGRSEVDRTTSSPSPAAATNAAGSHVPASSADGAKPVNNPAPTVDTTPPATKSTLRAPTRQPWQIAHHLPDSGHRPARSLACVSTSTDGSSSLTAPKLSLTATAADDATVDAVIIGTRQDGDQLALAPGSETVAAAFDNSLLDVLRSLGATGKADEIVKVPAMGRIAATIVVAAGLGSGEPTGEQVRRASGVAARSLAGTRRALTTLSTVDLQATVEGTILGSYRFDGYRSESGDGPLERLDLANPTEGSTREHRATLKAGTAIAEAVNTARDFVNTPPNDLYPASFADRAAAMARDAGIEVSILDEKALRKAGFGGVLGVGLGSARPPRVLRLSYRGPKARKKVALVGKGITFDTGGISIKPAANMDEMSSDMSGAAAVIATVILAAKLKYPLEVIATVPMAENMPSGTAYRPGDVLTIYGGKTVEVLNTDAEGRLILADAIVRACEDNPDYLIDTATLTGAQLVALGRRTSGIMGTDDFRDRVSASARSTGEGGWPMPLPEELRRDLDSKLADLANVTGHRWGGMLAAGLFLKEFVPDGLPWAHIDIAGPAFNSGAPWGYNGKGGTGVPVRTLASVLADIAENG
jgi:leucyl aminopeptidase